MRSLAIAVIAALSGGCQSDPVTSPGELSPSATATQLHLEVTAEPTVVERGEVLHIRLMVTNQGAAPVWKGFSSGCIYGFNLRSQQGEVVAPPHPVCTMHAPVVMYMPGEAVTSAFEWVYDDPSIGPGTYEVTAGLGPRGEGESPQPIAITLK